LRIHHINCGTMCPFGGPLFGGEGGPLSKGRIVCHCLLIESDQGLVLLDTGFGSADIAQPGRLGRPFRTAVRPQLKPDETALAQVRALELDPADVGDVIVTHLDVDHAGGLADFPDADVHVFAPERAAAEHPSLRERERYRRAHFAHGPKWVEHEVSGDRWFGFESVRVLPGGDDEIALIPLVGHTRGHTAVAVNTSDGWLLHCGDAFFYRGETETPPRCPPGFRVFQTAMAADNASRRRNQERLRELAREHGDEVTLFCSHDPVQLDRLAAAT
jgi:glyoxylase-like metal-dependent hydrolase (beta-lactamase superfamily II)